MQERLLFERLAVFAGSWSLDAAEELAGSPGSLPQTDVLDGLAALVNASLVQQTVGADGEPRLQLLRRIGNRGQIPRLVHNLGQVALRQGDLVRAGGQFVASCLSDLP